MRQEQYGDAEQNPGAMKAPGQQRSRNKDRIIEKADAGGGEYNPSRFEQQRRAQQNGPAGQEKLFQRSPRQKFHGSAVIILCRCAFVSEYV